MVGMVDIITDTTIAIIMATITGTITAIGMDITMDIGVE
jgi:hypothetical protein